MKKYWFHKKIICFLFFPTGLLLTTLAANNPLVVEKIYSQGVYLQIRRFISMPVHLLSFSLGEMLVYLLLLFLLFAIIKMIYKVYHGGRLKYFVVFIINCVAIFSCLYFIFVVSWGLNYHRLPFADLAELEIQPASYDTLEKLSEDLIEKTNRLRQEVAEKDDGTTYISNGFTNVAHRVQLGFSNLKGEYPFLSIEHPMKPKGILFSEGLSYAGISGIYFPFTGEANVNTKIPHSLLPSTVAHELAHFLGFAREDEANYIAYLACTSHPDKDFQYSGSLLALIHTMNAVYRNDPETYHVLIQKYSDNVKRDIIALDEFWDSYQGPIHEASTKMNNAYLKSNLQEDGVKSYGRMVDLLIAEFKAKQT